MFRCLFVLLILNSSYRSLGVPLPTSTTASLTTLLAALASSCENEFLSNQIKGQLDYCSAAISPHGGKQLECLLFYDINTQLCAAVAASKLAITEDSSATINKEQDINLVCANTKDWVFSNITEFPHYISSIRKVFKHPVPCGKMCGNEDLTSDDMKFACKYFKWGTELMKQQVSVLPTNENSPQLKQTSNIDNKSASPVYSELQDVQVKNAVTSKSLSVPLQVSQAKIEVTSKIEAVKPEASSENNREPSGVDTDADNIGSKAVIEEPMKTEAENPALEEQAEKSKQNEEIQNKASSLDSLSKPAIDNSAIDKSQSEIQKSNNDLEQKIAEIPNPDQPKAKEPNDDDYPDSEDGKDGLGDIQGDDDSDDPNIDDLNKNPIVIQRLKVDAKDDISELQNEKTISSGVISEKSLYPSYGEDAFSDDDDDHFFSFFLTAVIMVVVIYILYHNKNKVVKIFFGLILEGRQSGRRRNSRGHSYRRLDTLEQAMSTNSTAPPSKIIY